MAAARFFSGLGGSAITYVDLRPGWCRGPEGPARVPHTRWAAGEAACAGKSALARHSTGSAMAERLSLDPDPHTRGGLRGLTVGRPGQVRAAMLWLRVPKVGSGMVYPLHLPPPPVIGEMRTRSPVPHRPSAEAHE
jgi:hypothetical protein